MSPTSSRSSSISSSSSSSSKFSDGIKKKFGCTHPGCGKSFSRSEHLHRHALNHKDGNNTCLRCSAHFRRRDLLDRHMARHKEKDDEAGGPGLGILATRKRLWRDSDGNIVNARRPSYTQEGAKRRSISSQSERKSSTYSTSTTSDENDGPTIMSAALPSPMSRTGSSSSSTIVVDTGSPGYLENEEGPEKLEDLNQDSWLEIDHLPSPPISEESSSIQSAAQSPSADLSSELDTLYEDSWPVMHHGLPQIVNNSPVLGQQSEYPASPSWGPQPFQTFMGAMAELPYDDIFKPETGLYDWQAWNSQVLMSRCREEKFDPFEERKREWGSSYPGQDGIFRRGFGLGTA